jgi:hypothetical protein
VRTFLLGCLIIKCGADDYDCNKKERERERERERRKNYSSRKKETNEVETLMAISVTKL